MSDKYSTIHQHEPLRTPPEWGVPGKRFTAQLEELFDDLYSRLNRLRLKDLSSDVRELIAKSADGVRANRTAIEQTNRQITLLAAQETWDALSERMDQSEASLTVISQQIALKVSAGGIASAINQTNQSVLIDAQKINLEGYVTVQGLGSAGNTCIDGGRITTGTIEADRIDVDRLYVKHLNGADGTFTGTVTAGNWTFGSNGSVYSNSNQQVRMDVSGGVARYSTQNLTAQYGSTSYNNCRIYGGAVTLDCATTGQSVSARNGYWGAYSYSDVCFVCDQAGGSYETAAGNLGTTDNRWDVLWVDTIHYNTRDTASSRAVKYAIKPLPDYGMEIDRLVPVSYRYKDDKHQRTRYGLIYEDTISVMPDICHETREGAHSFRGISYEDLIAVLIKETQNLRTRVAELEERE